LKTLSHKTRVLFKAYITLKWKFKNYKMLNFKTLLTLKSAENNQKVSWNFKKALNRDYRSLGQRKITLIVSVHFQIHFSIFQILFNSFGQKISFGNNVFLF